MNGFEEILAKIATASNNSIDIEKCYRGDDGLLYCKNCGTARQFEHTIGGKSMIMAVPCKCMNDEIQRQKARAEHIKKMEKIAENRNRCFAEDTILKNWTFANDDGEGDDNNVMTKLRKYVSRFPELYADGLGIVIYGNVGVGKSYGAACVANALIDKGYTCYMTSFPKIKHTIMGIKDNKQEYIDSLNRYDLLVIDDLGAESDTAYTLEIETQVIDARLRSGKPLIVTTNYTADEMFDTSDLRKSRIFSRLKSKSLAFMYSGMDRRNKELKNNFAKYSDLML